MRYMQVFYLRKGKNENFNKNFLSDILVRYISPQVVEKVTGKAPQGTAAAAAAQRKQVLIDTKLPSMRMNDGAEYGELRGHLLATSEDCQLIFQLIAGILHLGQIQFQPRNQLNGEGSEILEEVVGLLEGESHLQIAGRLCL